jgi:hypothetical protein
VLDAMLFQAEAEMCWLDHCEATLVRYTPPSAPASSLDSAGPLAQPATNIEMEDAAEREATR